MLTQIRHKFSETIKKKDVKVVKKKIKTESDRKSLYRTKVSNCVKFYTVIKY